MQIREGATLAEILAQAVPDFFLHPYAVVILEGEEIRPGAYRLVRPKAGKSVAIRVVPRNSGGGNKNIFRAIATIAVIVVAYIAGQYYAGPALAGGLGFGAGCPNLPPAAPSPIILYGTGNPWPRHPRRGFLFGTHARLWHVAKLCLYLWVRITVRIQHRLTATCTFFSDLHRGLCPSAFCHWANIRALFLLYMPHCEGDQHATIVVAAVMQRDDKRMAAKPRPSALIANC